MSDRVLCHSLPALLTQNAKFKRQKYTVQYLFSPALLAWPWLTCSGSLADLIVRLILQKNECTPTDTKIYRIGETVSAVS